MKTNNLIICISDITELGGAEKVTYNFYTKIKNTIYKTTRLLSIYNNNTNHFKNDIDFLFDKNEKNNKKLLANRFNTYINTYKIDTIIFEIITLKEAVFLGNIAKRNGLKIFFVLHNTPRMYLKNFATFKDCLYSPIQIFRKIYKKILGGPFSYIQIKKILTLGKIITVGHNCEKELKTIFPKYQNNIYSIYNLTNLKKEKPKQNKSNKILYMGRFSLQKDMNLLLMVWKAFVKLNHVYELIIIGDGPEKEKIKKIIKKHKIPRVQLFERVDNVEYYYANSDICILTSHYEGLPTVFLEALSQNCYIFAAKSYGGTGELIKNNINGYYSETRRADFIARDLNTFVNKINFPASINDMSLEFNENYIIEKWKLLLGSEKDDVLY